MLPRSDRHAQRADAQLDGGGSSPDDASVRQGISGTARGSWPGAPRVHARFAKSSWRQLRAIP